MPRRLKRLICSLFFALACCSALTPFLRSSAQIKARSKAQLTAKVDFKRQIEPIFARSCYQCHGAKKAAGQLRLDLKDTAMKGGLSGAAIIAGAGKQSLLVKRLLGEDGAAIMPMGGDPLKPAEISLIRRWIDQGANWDDNPQSASQTGRNPQSAIQRHWAYVKPARPALPQIKNRSWVRNPIDAFILARLEKEGLTPSPEAEKATLLRRVYLDVIGLPPSVKEVDEFLADNSADAYEKVVDRLLANEHYGERWARPWLDLARYADSNGYEKDNLRVAWKFRDWVINAFNRDMPFDQFTIEQLAGDMLPNPTVDQKIATGFHRNTMVNQEGGIDPEESRFEILTDRVSTTATVWMGSTLACAQCHNHKYDPFSQKDYYRFMAFFDNAEYQVGYQTPGEDNSRFILEPQLNLPTPEQEESRKTLDATIKQVEAKLRTQTPELDAEQSKWERDLLDEQNKWTPLDPVKLESSGGASLRKLDDKSVLVSGPAAELDIYTIQAKTDLKNITALRLEALPDASLPKGGPGRDPYGNFLLTGVELVVTTPDDAQPREIAFKDAFVDDLAYKLETRPFFSKEPANTAIDRPPGWFVNATNDPGARLPRQGVFVASKPFGPGGSDSSAMLTIKLKQLGGSLNQGIGRFRLSVTTSDEPKGAVNISARLRPIISIPQTERTRKQKDDLSAQFRATTPSLKPDRDRLEKLRDEMKNLNITTALVMQERGGFDRPSTFFRERGSFLNKGEKVFAATPAVLPQIPENAPINRLGLARWLVDESNPLTARVAVNRFWEQIFGRGLVETSEDFGAQGERPWNSDLLDWLAVEFREPTWKAEDKGERQGDKGTREETKQADKTNPQSASQTGRNPQSDAWSMKRLVRMIVTSSTYRQASTTTPALLEKDPYNRFLARGPRFRMEAEMIRDLTLTASGLISPKLGGPSVFPLQPEGVWKAPYSGEKWSVSKGEDKYRRSLYTFVRRSSPHPAMMTFDATSREYCTVRRVRTNTPLQALTMLNDEAAMEAARALARRMIDHGAKNAEGGMEALVTFGFRTCVGRTPKEKEIQRVVALYKQQLRYFTDHEAEARKVSFAQADSSDKARMSEMAALTMVANILLNLDETLTKE